MNKKGFTLIELLAVIVILAVIALIATPVVMNSINNAREGAAKNAGFGVVKAIEHHMALSILNNSNHTPAGADYTIGTASAGGTFPATIGGTAFSIQGTPPTRTTISLSNGAVAADSQMCINGYHLTLLANDDFSVTTSGSYCPN